MDSIAHEGEWQLTGMNTEGESGRKQHLRTDTFQSARSPSNKKKKKRPAPRRGGGGVRMGKTAITVPLGGGGSAYFHCPRLPRG